MPTMTRAGYVPEKKPEPPKPPKKPAKKKKRKKRGMSGAAIASLVVFALAVCIGAATLLVYKTVEDSANVFSVGTMLSGHPLGGQTRAQGEAMLDELTAEKVAAWRFDITCQGRAYAVTTEDVGLHIDAHETLEPLWLVGKQGSLLERFTQLLGVRRENLDASPVFGYTLDPVDALLAQIVGETECDPVDATVTFVPGNSEPFRFTDERLGYAVDTTALRAKIVAALESLSPGSAELTPKTLEPQVTRDSLEEATVLRARVVLPLSGDEAALANAALAAGMLNGRRVAPGRTFSFNELVGTRTLEGGYAEAPEPAYGTGVSGVGGGVCQVASALYQAALLSVLDIQERHAAVYPLDNCEPGLEAAVSDQGLDLVVRNSTDFMLFITARVYGDDAGAMQLELQIIGEPLSARCRLECDVQEIAAPEEPVYVRDSEGRHATYTDERVPVGEAMPGYAVTVERVTLDADGGELAREVVNEERYEPVAATVYVGVTER